MANYPILRAFELQVALAASTMPRFYETIGHAIDPDKVPSVDARLVVQAAHAVMRETGNPCSDATIALQRIRRMVDDGRVTNEALLMAQDALEVAADLGCPDCDAMVGQLAPILRRDMNVSALQEAITDTGTDDGSGKLASKLSEKMDKIAGLGKRRAVTASMKHTEEQFAQVATTSTEGIMPTGILELDVAADGGLEKRAIGVVCGAPGAGKSLFLIQVACEAMLRGEDVFYVTLELNTDAILRRMYCNLFDMTKHDLAKSPKEAARRSADLRADGLGGFHLAYETPCATTLATIRARLREMDAERAQQGDHPIRFIVVDYADLMIVGGSKDKRGMYEDMQTVYFGLRDVAQEREGWLWTASQSTRDAIHKKKQGLQHASDSLHKTRAADLWLSIPRTEDDEKEEMVRFNVPKKREGRAHQEIGPLPMDGARGRIAPVCRRIQWK